MAMAIYKPASEVQAELPELLDLIESADEHIVVVRNDRPAAMLMSFQEYESLTETLDILSRRGALEQIREAESRYAAGEYATAADIRADLERQQKGK